MRCKVQLVVCAEDGQEDTVQELAVFDKQCQRLEHLGLTLAEAKQLLTTLLQHLVWLKISAVSTLLMLLRLRVYWSPRFRHDLAPQERL
jgi:hypothetical protein